MTRMPRPRRNQASRPLCSSSGWAPVFIMVTVEPKQIALSAPADGSLVFEPTELEAKAGTVTINFDNLSDSTPHAVEIDGNGVNEKSDTVTGAKTSVTADLEAGEYKIFCPVGTHASQGMEGTLTVK